MDERETALVAALRAIVGRRHLLTGARATRRYRTGYRFGTGAALAVVRPGSLVEQWRVLEAIIAADAIVIMQAANTGLTGGSTPYGEKYDRPVVILNTMRMRGIFLLEGGRQVLCLPGSTLYDLEDKLRPLGREPHSVIGSSCIGASVLGGVCNNSGGALVKRGPAFTELALYAQVDAAGALRLVNHLGIALGEAPEAILTRVERGDFGAVDIDAQPGRASDTEYAAHVREIDAATPARFNADPRRLFEASGSAGKLAVFAVRLDTFATEPETAVFYIGTNDPAELSRLRRDILTGFAELPIAAEYIHRDAFNIAEIYGRDTFLAIHHLGTRRLPFLFAAKEKLDALAGKGFSDRLLQRLSRFGGPHLPKRMTDCRDRFEHHLILKVAGTGIAEAEALLAARFPSAAGDSFRCTPKEAEAAFLHRFAVAGAAVRYREVHPETVEDIVALDIALPRSAQDWFETLPDAIERPILHKLYYGHFLCHVLHQDYVVAKGHDVAALEHAMLALLDARGARFPAEHNVGHLYAATPSVAEFYRHLDPTNSFSPGLGKTSNAKLWR